MKQGEGVGCRVLVVVHVLVVGEWAVIMGGPQSSWSMLLKAGMLRRNSFHGNWESNQSATVRQLWLHVVGSWGSAVFEEVVRANTLVYRLLSQGRSGTLVLN